MPDHSTDAFGYEEGEPETLTDPVAPLDPETVVKLREHGIEFSDWQPTIPKTGPHCSCGRPINDPCWECE